MNPHRVVVLVLSMGSLAALASAQTSTQAASQPASAGASQPASAPAGKVAATVGQVKIYAEPIDQYLAKKLEGATPERLAQARKQILDRLIEQELVRAYLRPLPPAEKELAEFRTRLADAAKKENVSVEQYMATNRVTEDFLQDQAKLKRLGEEAAAKEKVEAFVKENPAFFDGTTLQASHILIAVSPYASAAERDQARKKLQQVADDVKAGKVSFEDAAKKVSDCPSAQAGGDLGVFPVDKMDQRFSQAAMALKVGQTGDIVETPFGFHLIKLTGRSDGNGKPGVAAEDTAKTLLLGRAQTQMIQKALEGNPVVVTP